MSVTFDELTPAMQASYYDSLQPQYYAGLCICTVAIFIALGLRLYAQWRIGQIFRLDSWLAILAFFFTLVMNACNFVAIRVGGGLHLWTVFVEDPAPPSRLVQYHQAAWLVTVFNSASYCFIKLSMLAFLYRIFGSQRRAFRWCVYGLAAYSIVLGVATTIEFIVQCIPVDYFWTRAYLILAAFTKTEPVEDVTGWCMPQNVHTVVPLVAAMLSDILLLFLPTMGLWGVRLTRGKKAGIVFALSLGFFALALDIVRIYEVFQIQNDSDLTWVNTPSILWCSIEYSVAFLCICIPGMAPLLRSDSRKRGWHTGQTHTHTKRDPQVQAYGHRTLDRAQRDSFDVDLQHLKGSEPDLEDMDLPIEGHRAEAHRSSGGAWKHDTQDEVRVTTELDVTSSKRL